MSTSSIEDKKLKQNGSGCADPTAYEAIKSVTKHAKGRNDEVHQAITLVKNLLKKFDLVVITRIEIKDKRTGKIYR